MPEYPETYNSVDEENAFEKRMQGDEPALPSSRRKMARSPLNLRERIMWLQEAMTDWRKNYLLPG